MLSVLIERAIDGHTSDTRRGTILRFNGFDTPELSEPYGLEAMEHLRQMIAEGEVKIDQFAEDHYQHLIAEVWFGDESVNYAMDGIMGSGTITTLEASARVNQ